MSCGKEEFRPRYESCMDTWVKDFDRVFFFAGEEAKDDRLVSLDGVGEDYSSAFYKQMYGLGYMYFKSPSSDWYFICGDDNFLYKEHMHEKISQFDSSQDLFIGGHCGNLKDLCRQEIWYLGKKQEFWKEKAKEWDVPYASKEHVDKVRENRDKYWSADYFPSGGAGFFLSNSLLKKSLYYIAEFVDIWPQVCKEKLSRNKVAACDVAIAIMMYEYLGIKLTVIDEVFGMHPSVYETDRKGLDKPISFHYITPKEMHRLYDNKQKGIYK